MKNWLGIVAITFALFGSATAGLNYFAKASDLRVVAQAQTYHFKDLERGSIQERIWALERRYGNESCCAGWKQADVDEIKRLAVDLKRIERELTVLTPSKMDGGVSANELPE